MNAPTLLRIAQLARFWDKNPQTLIAWIRLGRLAAVRSPGGHYRVRVADVRAFCEREGMPVPPAAARPVKRAVIAHGVGRLPRVAGIEVEVCDGAYAALVTAIARRASLLVLPATDEGFDAEGALLAVRAHPELADLAVVIVGATGRARTARLERAGAARVLPRARAGELGEVLRALAGDGAT